MPSPAVPDRGVLESVTQLPRSLNPCSVILIVGALTGCAPQGPTSLIEEDVVVVLRRDAARDSAPIAADAATTTDAVTPIADASPPVDAAILPPFDSAALTDRAALPDTFVVDVRVVGADTSLPPNDTSVAPPVDAGTHEIFRVAISGTVPSTIMFDDVAPEHLGLPFIQRVAAYGILPRCSATTNIFCPDRNATRREAAVAVTNAKFYGSQFMYRRDPFFTDVGSDAVGFRQIQNMRETGVTVGCTVTTFCPEGTIARAEAAVFIVRSLLGDSFTSTLDPYFDDVPTSHPQYRYIQKMRDLGITSGCGTRMFCPADALPRWQLATFVSRAFFPEPADGGT